MITDVRNKMSLGDTINRNQGVGEVLFTSTHVNLM